MAEPRSRVSNAEVLAELRAMSQQLGQNTADTREARDGMLAIKAVMTEQNVGQRLTVVEKQIAGQPEAVRAIVKEEIAEAAKASNERLAEVEADIQDHGRRLGLLETAKARRDGVQGLLGRVFGLVPQFLSAVAGGVMALLAAAGLRHH